MESAISNGSDNNSGQEGTYIHADAVKIIRAPSALDVSDVKFVHGDHLGTPQYVTDDSGTVIWSAEYQPFGEALVDEDPDADLENYSLNVRFPGQYYDAESGLHYNYFRDYDPEIGRYIESSTLIFRRNVNTFASVDNNPLRWVSPEGSINANSLPSGGQAFPSTIECDGNGNLVVVNNDSDKCTRECTEVHEESHRQDWIRRYGSNLCLNKQRGYLPTGGENYDQFLDASECRAWRVDFNCMLSKEKEECDCTNDPSFMRAKTFALRQRIYYCGTN